MFKMFRLPKAFTMGAALAFAAYFAVLLPAIAQSAATATDAGTVWWNELISASPEKSRDFYTGVIGWTPKVVAAEDESRAPNPGEPEYSYLMQGAVAAAGIARFEKDEPVTPKPGWLAYIQVKDVDASVTEAVRRGGKVLRAPYSTKTTGRLAVIEDLDGNPFGLFTPLAQTPPATSTPPPPPAPP